jgi:uncharacterized membrane protein
MRSNEFFAFLLTLIALLMVIGGLAYSTIGFNFGGLDCGYFDVQVEPEFNNIELEKGKGDLVKVELTNIGVEDEYKLSIKEPDWSLVKPRKVRLEQGESEELFVYISPTFDASGEYDVTLNVKSYCVDEDFKIRVNVQ